MLAGCKVLRSGCVRIVFADVFQEFFRHRGMEVDEIVAHFQVVQILQDQRIAVIQSMREDPGEEKAFGEQG